MPAWVQPSEVTPASGPRLLHATQGSPQHERATPSHNSGCAPLRPGLERPAAPRTHAALSTTTPVAGGHGSELQRWGAGTGCPRCYGLSSASLIRDQGPRQPRDATRPPLRTKWRQMVGACSLRGPACVLFVSFGIEHGASGCGRSRRSWQSAPKKWRASTLAAKLGRPPALDRHQTPLTSTLVCFPSSLCLTRGVDGRLVAPRYSGSHPSLRAAANAGPSRISPAAGARRWVWEVGEGL